MSFRKELNRSDDLPLSPIADKLKLTERMLSVHTSVHARAPENKRRARKKLKPIRIKTYKLSVFKPAWRFGINEISF